MNRLKRLNSLLLFIAAIIVLEIAASARLATNVGKLTLGVLVNYDYQNDRWAVALETPDWWPGFNNSGTSLKYGDIVWDTNSPCLLSPPPVLRDLLNYKLIDSPGPVNLPVQRGSDCITLNELSLIKLSWGQFVDIWLPDFIMWLGYLGLAVIIWRASPRDPLNRNAVLVLGLMAALFSLEQLEIFEAPDAPKRVMELISILVRCLIPFAFLQFTLLFPTPILKKEAPIIIRVFAILCILTAGYYAFSRIYYWQTGSPEKGIGFMLSSYLGIASLVFLIIRILHSIFVVPNQHQLKQLAVIVCGIFLAVPFLVNHAYAVGNQNTLIVVLTVAAVLIFMILFFSRGLRKYSVFRRVWLSLGVTVSLIGLLTFSLFFGPNLFIKGIELKYLMLFVPLAFTYVIVRYKSFHGSDRAIGMILILIISAILANTVALILHKQYMAEYAAPPFSMLFFTTFPFGVFCSFNSAAKGSLGRIMNRIEWDLQATKIFMEHVIGNFDREALPSRIVKVLTIDLQVSPVSFWEYDREQGFILAETSHDFPNLKIKSIPADIWPDKPVLLGEGSTNRHPIWEYLYKASRSKVAVGLFSPDTHEPLGLLTLGSRDEQEYYDLYDLEIVAIIAQQCALLLRAANVFLERAKAYQWASVAEQEERERIANAMHDEILQYLPSQSRYLELIQDSFESNPELALELIRRSIKEIEFQEKNLRQTLFELKATQFDGDISQILLEQLSEFKLREAINVEGKIDLPFGLNLSKLQKQTLFDLLHEGLANIAKHAEAKNVIVEVTQRDGSIFFAITDDGKGFAPARLIEAFQDQHMGVHTMKHKLVLIGGIMTIISAPEKGTRIEGYFPQKI